ncbi:MAG TPA: ABC transporter permease [Ktedonobacteraceae bacterium]|jgi:osmoprotectant transport system permease protein
MDLSLTNIALLTWQHLSLSIIGTLVGGLIGSALAVLLRAHARWITLAIGLAEIIQTIPGIALLAFLLLAFGLGNTTLVVGLGLYAILPVLQNTYEGLENIDPVYQSIGKGMGMTRGQIFLQIEVPLAFPLILAGLRNALVTSIGVTTIGVFIGADGLGTLIYRGLQQIYFQAMLAGAIPAGLLAILVEVGLTFLERRLSKNVAQQ